MEDAARKQSFRRPTPPASLEDVLSRVLVEPIRNVYALLWRLGALDVDDEEL